MVSLNKQVTTTKVITAADTFKTMNAFAFLEFQ
jgi:hypothetical protein